MASIICCSSKQVEERMSRIPFSIAASLATFVVFTSVVLGAALVVRAQAPASRQRAATQGEPPLRTHSRLVMLDVVVTDRAGNPVTGLHKDDFTVLEDGQPQKISNFETPAAHFNVGSVNLPSGDPTAAADEAKRGEADRPETIIVLDELNTTSEDMSFAWQMLLKFLNKQPATLSDPTAVMVLTKKHLQKIAGPTQNTALLVAKVQKIDLELPSHSNTGGTQGSADLMLTSLLALDEIALSSADRESRKNVIWVGTGFPILSSYDVPLVDRERFLSYVQYTANWLQETRTTMYTIDPKGLPVADEDFVASLGSTVVSQSAANTPSELIFEGLAPATGGKIYRLRNDIDVAIASAVNNGATYYTLAYYPKNTEFDGKFRKIRVQVAPPGLDAATQQGYYAIDEGFGASKKELDFALSRAVTSPLPFASVQFDAVGKVLFAPPPSARFSVSLDRDTVSWNHQSSGDQRAEITLVIAEISGKDAVLAYKVKEMEILVTKNDFENSTNGRVTFIVNTPLPPRTDRVRFVIRDAASGRLGTFDVVRQALGHQLSASK
jgi:VWFA-related protein